MKTVRVVAAVIREGGRVFATQRGYGAFKDGWEFPGGKVEPGESAEDCVVRECREELGVTLRVLRRHAFVVRDDVRLIFFVCEIAQGEPECREHSEIAWVSPEALDGYAFCPADAEMLRGTGVRGALQ